MYLLFLTILNLKISSEYSLKAHPFFELLNLSKIMIFEPICKLLGIPYIAFMKNVLIGWSKEAHVSPKVDF